MSSNSVFARRTENLSSSILDIQPVAGHIGAEIYGVDPARPLAEPVVAAIYDALLRHKVVFFRGQLIGHAEHVAFTRYFGEVTPSHPYDDEAPEDFPQILAVDSEKYERHFRSRQYSYDNRWYTDVTALVNPPKGTVLRAEQMPSQGGDTTWTNLVAAYEGCPNRSGISSIPSAPSTVLAVAIHSGARAATMTKRSTRTRSSRSTRSSACIPRPPSAPCL